MEPITLLILSIAGSLILILLGIIGYFINRFAKTVDKLDQTLEELQLAFATAGIDNFKTNVAKELDNLYDKCEDHDRRLTRLESYNIKK